MVTDYRRENHLQDEIKYSHEPLRNHGKSNRTAKQQQVSLTSEYGQLVIRLRLSL